MAFLYVFPHISKRTNKINVANPAMSFPILYLFIELLHSIRVYLGA
jgi:hypothetical protein